MIRHHPEDDRLLALAAGRLPEGPALVVSVHLEGCGECRARLHTLQAVGGAVLDEAASAVLAADALERVLVRIDAPAPATPRTSVAAASPSSWPADVQWPASLRGSRVSDWRWMAPSMRFARINLPEAPQASLFLLRIGAGRSLPRHGHRGAELTQVLSGSFHDGRDTFAAGDLDDADYTVQHRPVVSTDAECICLVYLDAPLRFDGRVARFVGGLVGL